MAIYIFFSEGDVCVFALTASSAGKNLPSEYGPWSRCGDGKALYSSRRGDAEDDPVSNPVIAIIMRDGFYLGRTNFRH